MCIAIVHSLSQEGQHVTQHTLSEFLQFLVTKGEGTMQPTPWLMENYEPYEIIGANFMYL